jgi:hypothetical protein
MLKLHRSAAWTARLCRFRSRALSTSLRAFQTPSHVAPRRARRASAARSPWARGHPRGSRHLIVNLVVIRNEISSIKFKLYRNAGFFSGRGGLLVQPQWYGMVPPQPPVSVFRSLRVVASFSTCPTREASGGPVNQRLFEDGLQPQ